MFSGIVEGQSEVIALKPNLHTQTLIIKKPKHFNDIRIGDSIAVNGICLTVEKMSDDTLQFALGPETLKVTGWNDERFKSTPVNLERSLRLDQRLHGHLVTGHVDGMAVVTRVQEFAGETKILRFKILDHDLMSFLWQKGSVTLNGVSLTVNLVDDHNDEIEVCLIPETLRRTNLQHLKLNHQVTLEIDQWARAHRRMAAWSETNGFRRESDVEGGKP